MELSQLRPALIHGLFCITIAAAAQEPRRVGMAEVRALIGKEERVTVRGQMMFETAPGFLFLSDESGPVRAILVKPVEFHQGDLVEVTGTPTKFADHSWLTFASAVRVGPKAMPPPKRLSGGKVGEHDAQYVTTKARVVDHSANVSNYTVEGKRIVLTLDALLVESEGVFFKVMFHQRVGALKRYPAGSVADFTGIVRGRGEFGENENYETHLLVNEAADVTVLSMPPFWSTREFRRQLMIAGIAVLVIAAAIGLWIIVQRRRMKLLQAAEDELRLQNAALERRVSERTAELAESEAKFRTLFESNSSAVLIHDDERVLDCNPAALKIFGYKREELIGRHPGSLSPPTQPGGKDAMTLAMWHLNQALTNGSHQFEWMSVKGDGTPIPVEIVLTPTSLNGRPVLQALVQDISKRKQAEEAVQRDISERQRVQSELERALAREREVSDLRANFVSLVSHEFRTPLGVIMSASDVLQRYFDRLSPEKRARHFEMILSSTRNLAALIDEVLLLGRVEEGRMQFAPRPVNLEKLCRALCDELRSATKGGGSIHFQALTPLDGGVSDEAVLRHIISNLLSNAVKYGEPGSEVDFTAARKNGDAVMVIRDHGIGIPEDEQARLFTSFTRASNVGNRPGTGLGLVVVQRCVQLHGGSIQLVSAPGEGTTVTVTLPVFPSES